MVGPPDSKSDQFTSKNPKTSASTTGLRCAPDAPVRNSHGTILNKSFVSGSLLEQSKLDGSTHQKAARIHLSAMGLPETTRVVVARLERHGAMFQHRAYKSPGEKH